MSEIKTNLPDTREFIARLHGGDCFLHTWAFREDGWGGVYITPIGWCGDSYWSTWRGRLRLIWYFLRDKRPTEIEILDRDSAEAILADLREAVDYAFSERSV